MFEDIPENLSNLTPERIVVQEICSAHVETGPLAIRESLS
jgi:hypothetical protein